jgi:protein SCO1/2
MSRYLGGIHFAPRDLRLSLVEASNGRIGSAVDQVMMLCYMYDPTVGRYGFAIMTLMRTAGALTVFTLAAAVVVMIRRDRRAGRSSAPVEFEDDSPRRVPSNPARSGPTQADQ